MQEVRRSKPNTLAELKRTVESFAESLDQEEGVKSGTSGSVPEPASTLMAPPLREASKRILRDLDQAEE